jgi:hypothetical protein
MVRRFLELTVFIGEKHLYVFPKDWLQGSSNHLRGVDGGK